MVCRSSLAAAILPVLLSCGAHAAEPARLSFAVGDDVVPVAGRQITEVTIVSDGILRFCLDPQTEGRLSAFTKRHVGDLIDVAVDGDVVFRPTIGKPYSAGCISWPVGVKRSPELRDRLLAPAGAE